MMTETKYVEDMFHKQFNEEEHAELLAFLREMEKDTHWETVEAKEVYFVPLETVPEEELADGQGDGYKDSLSSPLPICAVLPDGRNYLMRPYLLKNIKQHHRDNAAVLGDMLNRGDIHAFCEHVSLGRPFLKKKLLMLLRGEKISGWFSEFNGNWSQLSQVEYFEGKMQTSFPDMSYIKSEVSHYFTAVEYRLDETLNSRTLQEEMGMRPGVMDSYVEAWARAGLPEKLLREAEPRCQFITGESGLTSIEVRTNIRLSDGTIFPLGGVLSVNHRGKDDAVWGKFEGFPDQVAVLYQKGLAGVERLCGWHIAHPYCAMTHILSMFRASIPAATLRNCAEDAQMFWPREEPDNHANAIDLFNMVNEMVNTANQKLTPVRRLRNLEMVGRLLHTNWNQFDVGTVNKFFGKEIEVVISPDDDFGI